jgi:hypothetical protein
MKGEAMLAIEQVGEFRPCGSEKDPYSRILAPVLIGGIQHHMEGYAVFYDTDEVQMCADTAFADAFEEIDFAIGGDGAWHTIELFNREYVLVVTPYRN